MFAIPAVIVAAIGEDEQSLAGIPHVAHLAQAHVDRVQQRSAPVRMQSEQVVVDLVGAGGEIGDHARHIGKRDDEEFVLGICDFTKLQHGVARVFPVYKPYCHWYRG